MLGWRSSSCSNISSVDIANRVKKEKERKEWQDKTHQEINMFHAPKVYDVKTQIIVPNITAVLYMYILLNITRV